MTGRRTPLLIYDSGCSACVRQVGNLRRLVGGRFEAVSFRDPGFARRHPDIPLSECERALQFVSAEGRRCSGAEAAARVMALRPLFRPLLWVYRLPGLRPLWDRFYEEIARRRSTDAA